MSHILCNKVSSSPTKGKKFVAFETKELYKKGITVLEYMPFFFLINNFKFSDIHSMKIIEESLSICLSLVSQSQTCTVAS